MSDDDTTTAAEDFRTPDASDEEDDAGRAGTGSGRAPPDTRSASDRASATDAGRAGAPIEIPLPDEPEAALTPEAVRDSQHNYSNLLPIINTSNSMYSSRTRVCVLQLERHSSYRRSVQATNELVLQLYREFPLPASRSPKPPSRSDPRSVAAGLGSAAGASLQYGWSHDSGDDFETAIVYGKYIGPRKFFRCEVRSSARNLQYSTVLFSKRRTRSLLFQFIAFLFFSLPSRASN